VCMIVDVENLNARQKQIYASKGETSV